MDMVAGFDRRRFGQACIVDVVSGSPRVVHPVRRNFQQVMRVVDVVVEHQTVRIHQLAELFEALVIPGIELREVELTQPVGGGSRTAARPRHFVEGGPHVGVGTHIDGMLVAAAVVPEAGDGVIERHALLHHALRQRGQIFGEAGTGSARDEAGDGVAAYVESFGRFSAPSGPFASISLAWEFHTTEFAAVHPPPSERVMSFVRRIPEPSTWTPS